MRITALEVALKVAGMAGTFQREDDAEGTTLEAGADLGERGGSSCRGVVVVLH